MENSSDSEEDSLELASKTWSKVIHSAAKIGFGEGVTDGSMSVFQDGFDKGYEDSFKTSLLIGVYKGFANSLLKHIEHPSEIENILSASKNGFCNICNTENSDNNAPTKTITEIQINQKEFSDRILKTLQSYFNSMLEEYNIHPELLII